MSIEAKNIPNAVIELKNSFKTGKTMSYEWRMQQLEALDKMLREG